MFWDRIAFVYDIFTNIINKKTHDELCLKIAGLVSDKDKVLECACGTGLLTGVIAERCDSLVATDFSKKMLLKAKKKHRAYQNITFQIGNILDIKYPDESFDLVIAANVIHLLEEPKKALKELDRVCKCGGKIIIPTYISQNKKGNISFFAAILNKAGVNFKRQFTPETYRSFIEEAGYRRAKFSFIKGKIPCAVAEIKKRVDNERG